MILYTPMQLELVLEGLENMSAPNTREIRRQGVPMVVEDVGSGKVKVTRLLSTDPKDYLLNDISPGNIIDIDCH